MTLEQTRRLDPLPLAGVAAAVLLLVVIGIFPVWPGLIQLVALPPLDLMSDLRVLLVYAPGWPGTGSGSPSGSTCWCFRSRPGPPR